MGSAGGFVKFRFSGRDGAACSGFGEDGALFGTAVMFGLPISEPELLGDKFRRRSLSSCMNWHLTP